MINVPFNKPYFTGNETTYIRQAVESGKISGNGDYTKRCQIFFERRYGFKKALLTSSCTDALEMAAILADISEGDEVIVPSYTFVSTALAFIRQGAKIVFADSYSDNPNINPHNLESLISPNTKVIVPVHYAGVACDMDTIMQIAEKYNLLVIEDAAQAIDSYYIGKDGKKSALGSIGHLAAFSFHETKNIIAGEGGMLTINDDRFIERAEIIWEKGTNRSSFFRGEVDKYGWVDTGSSFLPSEITAAFLWAQLENIDDIQSKRKLLWNTYSEFCKKLLDGQVDLPYIPPYATNNGHMFYLVTNDIQHRTRLIDKLKTHGYHAVFHYLSLHSSPYYQEKYEGSPLLEADKFSDRLLRLPFYYELDIEDVKKVIQLIDENS